MKVANRIVAGLASLVCFYYAVAYATASVELADPPQPSLWWLAAIMLWGGLNAAARALDHDERR